MHMPSTITAHVRAIRDWLRTTDLTALVIQTDGPPAVPVAPVRLCPHCRLPGGEHAPCRESNQA